MNILRYYKNCFEALCIVKSTIEIKLTSLFMNIQGLFPLLIECSPQVNLMKTNHIIT